MNYKSQRGNKNNQHCVSAFLRLIALRSYVKMYVSIHHFLITLLIFNVVRRTEIMRLPL